MRVDDITGYSRALLTFVKTSGSNGVELMFSNRITVSSGDGSVGQTGTIVITDLTPGTFSVYIHGDVGAYRITNLWLE